jgi:hypothetical protein
VRNSNCRRSIATSRGTGVSGLFMLAVYTRQFLPPHRFLNRFQTVSGPLLLVCWMTAAGAWVYVVAHPGNSMSWRVHRTLNYVGEAGWAAWPKEQPRRR